MVFQNNSIEQEESVHGLVRTLRSQGNQSEAACATNVVSQDGKQQQLRVARQGRPKMHQDSSQVEGLFNPVRGIRDEQIRRGIKPVNHARNNKNSIRQQSQLNHLRKLQAETEQQQLVPGWSRPSSSVEGPSRSAKFDRHVRQPGERDFIKENKVESLAPKSAHKAPAKEDPDASVWLQKDDFGKVPRYLQQRKIEMAADYARKQAEKEQSLLPDGARVLNEEERLQVLAKLEQQRDEAEAALRKLPFIVETPSLIRQKRRLEDELEELAKQIRKFSMDRVIVVGDIQS